MHMRRLGELGAVVLAVVLAGCGGAPAGFDSWEPGTLKQAVGTMQKVTGFGSNPGNLIMYKYVPDNVPPNAPLVVAMHGCTQTANDYAQVGWNQLADAHKFYVLHVEQNTSNNPARCFNWGGEYGDPTNIRRGEGENLSIKQMVDKMKADHPIDANRVFTSGFSGGGAQVALMLAVYPDVFAAGAIQAGIPYNCTTTFSEVSGCLSPGKNLTPAEWSKRVRDAFPSFTGTYPRVSILQGTQDSVVSTNNRVELLEQWTAVHGADQTADVSGAIEGHAHKQYKNGAGQVVVETIDVNGMGHGVPVDASSGCGTAGAYRLEVGLCGAELAAKFFGLLDPKTPGEGDGGVVGGDTQAPVVDLSEPASGSVVTGQTVVRVTASDDVAVTKVEFFVGQELLGTDNAAPYEFVWNTGLHSNGSYTLTVTAHDAAGNVGTDSDTTVTVANDSSTAGDTTPPVTTATPAGGDFDGEVVVVLKTNEPAVTYFTLDGNSPTTKSPVYVDSLKFVQDVTLRFFSVDASGNHEKIQMVRFTRNPDGATGPGSSTTTSSCSSAGMSPGVIALFALLGLAVRSRRARRSL